MQGCFFNCYMLGERAAVRAVELNNKEWSGGGMTACSITARLTRTHDAAAARLFNM
jgi:hypothetical protein